MVMDFVQFMLVAITTGSVLETYRTDPYTGWNLDSDWQSKGKTYLNK